MKEIIKNNLVGYILLGIVVIAIFSSIMYVSQAKDKTGGLAVVGIISYTDGIKKMEEGGLLTFEVISEDLTNDQKEEYNQDFDQAVVNFLIAEELAQKSDSDSGIFAYMPTVNIGNIHRKVGNFTKAELAYQIANQLKPDELVSYGNLGNLYKDDLHDFESAEKNFIKAIKKDFGYIEQYYLELYEIYRVHYEDNRKAEDLLNKSASISKGDNKDNNI